MSCALRTTYTTSGLIVLLWLITHYMYSPANFLTATRHRFVYAAIFGSMTGDIRLFYEAILLEYNYLVGDSGNAYADSFLTVGMYVLKKMHLVILPHLDMVMSFTFYLHFYSFLSLHIPPPFPYSPLPISPLSYSRPYPLSFALFPPFISPQ